MASSDRKPVEIDYRSQLTRLATPVELTASRRIFDFVRALI
jgi:hypothetical protein